MEKVVETAEVTAVTAELSKEEKISNYIGFGAVGAVLVGTGIFVFGPISIGLVGTSLVVTGSTNLFIGACSLITVGGAVSYFKS